MDFPSFFNFLYPYIGKDLSEVKFARILFESIVDFECCDNDPITEYDDSTFKHYIKNRRGIGKFSKTVYEHLNPGKFAAYINRFDDAAHEAICGVLKPYYSQITTLNVGDVCAEIFKGIIKSAAETPTRKSNNERVSVINASDFLLLYEFDMECPQCKKSLVQNVKGRQVRNYTIVNIDFMEMQKESVNTANEIALCDSCAKQIVVFAGEDEKRELQRLKSSVLHNLQFRKNLDSQDLIEGIEKILNSLAEGYKTEKEVKLTKKALAISRKISNNTPLLERVEHDVKKYFGVVQELINQCETQGIFSMNKLTCCIGNCYENICSDELSQQEIFDAMVDWLNEKSGVKNKTICGILISFFVQSCQVFHETTK